MIIDTPHITLNDKFEITYIDKELQDKYPAFAVKSFFKNLLSGYKPDDFASPIELTVSPVSFEKLKIVFIRSGEEIECIPVKNKDYIFSQRMKNAETILKEPVPSIMSSLSIIQDSLLKRTVDFKNIYNGIDVINNSALSMYRNITNMALASNVLSGIFPKMQVVDFSSIIDDVVDTVDKFIPYVEIVSDIDENIFIDSNSEFMTNAITNLFANSIAFREDDNVHIEIKLKREPGKTVFSYSDNSKGISPEILPHIFKPYFSKDPYDDEEIEPSMGLGLFLVKSAFDQCGGNILVTSDQNVGGVKYTSTIPYSRSDSTILESQSLWLMRSKLSTVAVQLSGVHDIPFER